MSARRSGFTLIELVVVMGVIALLLGAGVGLVARLKVADRAAVGVVENVIRAARNWAVAREAGARVRIDRAAGRIQAFGLSVVGTWHFEALPITGAFGQEGTLLGGELIEDGFTGRALSFVGQPSRSRVEIPAQVDPAFDLARGFSVACAVRVQGDEGGELLQIGDSVGLGVAQGGGVQAWIAPEVVGEDGEPRRGGRVSVATPAGLLRPGRWAQVELQYDRRALRLIVDGAPVARADEDARVWRLEGPLVLSPTSAPFPGAVDALVVAAVAGDEARDLPKGVTFDPATPAEIVFDAGGGLDREVHREPVRLGLEFDDGRKERIVVNLYGTVE
jgi:prepilin-type N-terminal cleavage/methylation domain-containing protein